MAEQSQNLENDSQINGTHSKTNAPHSNKSGWDGKLRVNKQAVITNSEALSDPEYSDDDAPPPEQIEADEGTHLTLVIGSELG